MHGRNTHTRRTSCQVYRVRCIHACRGGVSRWCPRMRLQMPRARACAVTCCPCSLSPLPSCCRVATQRPGVSLYLCLPSPLSVHPSFHHPFILFFLHHTPCHSTFPLHHSPKHAGPPHRRRAVKENPHSEAPQSVSCCRSDAHTHTTRPPRPTCSHTALASLAANTR